MKRAPSYRALLNRFNACPLGLRGYLSHFPMLVENYAYEVCLAYLFLRTEMAQNRTLYCGVVKIHHGHGEVAQKAVDSEHLTREGFLRMYKNIFGKALPDSIASCLKKAESIRDKVVHGKAVSAAAMREAIWDVLDYADRLNSHLKRKAGFQPFGDLRGFKGRAQPLDKTTTRWLLKGMGFRIR